MKILKEYSEKRQELFDYFGYAEDWAVIPVDDATSYYWGIQGGEGYGGEVRFSEIEKKLLDEDEGDYYVNQIYTQRHLPKWVYRGEDYTMICVDTNCDGNKFLQIFSNNLERNI